MAKREAAMLDAAGDKEGFEAAALKAKQKQGELNDFCRATGRTLRSDRTQVLGYNRSVAGKARAAGEKYSAYHFHKDGTIVVTDDWKGRTDHFKIPGSYKPFAVIESLSGKHRQVDRTLYDGQGVISKQIHSKAHLKWEHPDYTNNGAHAHEWIDGKRITYGSDSQHGRNLNGKEEIEHADIINK